jgi:hypothetical protein
MILKEIPMDKKRVIIEKPEENDARGTHSKTPFNKH